MKHAIFQMLLSVLLYSFFPVVGAVSAERINPFTFIGIAHVFAFLFLGLITCFVTARGRLTVRGALLYPFFRPALLSRLIVAAILNAISHASLFTALLFLNKAAATLLYEVWPILIIVVISRLMPKRYPKLPATDWIFAAMALGGLCLVMFGETSSSKALVGFSALDVETVFGLCAATVSAVTMAVSSALGIKNLEAFDRVEDTVSAAIVSQFFVRLFSAPASLGIGFAAAALVPTNIDLGLTDLVTIEPEIIALAAGTGIFINALGAITYHIANAQSASSNINILWYATPVLSVLWLYLFGLTEVSSAIILGGVLIVSANLLLSIRADPHFAYTGTLIVLSFSAIFCYYIPGTALSDYFDLLGFLTGFFAILVAFMLSRIARRRTDLEDRFFTLQDRIIQDEGLGPDTRERLQKLSLRILKERNRPRMELAMLRESLSGPDEAVQRYVPAFYRLALGKLNIFTYGEVFVLWLLGGFCFVAANVFRQNTFLGDAVAVLIAAVIAFLCFAVLDQRDERALQTLDFLYEREDLGRRENDLKEYPYTSSAMIGAVLVLYGLALGEKYGVIGQLFS